MKIIYTTKSIPHCFQNEFLVRGRSFTIFLYFASEFCLVTPEYQAKHRSELNNGE
ncbi:hypothetical protein HMPREF9554_01969 [Treponema phagedenis F0421]|nr:hypothetical protein HMPREF9554_01969 [Treponema phagedenis F0421]